MVKNKTKFLQEFPFEFFANFRINAKKNLANVTSRKIRKENLPKIISLNNNNLQTFNRAVKAAREMVTVSHPPTY